MVTFKRLLGFLAPYRAGVWWSLGLAAAAMVMTVSIPFLVGKGIDAINEGRREDLLLLGGLIAGAGLGRLGLTFVRRLIAGRVSLGVEYDLRKRIYGHLLSLELAFFDRQQTGQLMSRATLDLQAVRFFLGYGLVFIMQSALTLVLAAIAMLFVDPVLAALSLLPVPFVIVVATRYGKRSRPAIQEVQQRLAELTADVEESIGGVRVIKAFAAEGRQNRRIRHSSERIFTQAMVSTRLQAYYNPFIAFLPQLGLAAILFFGGRRVIDGTLTIGDFTAFYAYLLMLLGPMRTLGVSLGQAQRATASGARLFEILDRQPAILAPDEARTLPEGDGHVQFEGVWLRYEGSPEPALKEIDLVVPAGTTVALVGATGSGKTTLVQLLARLYDVTDGAVKIDGADVRTLDPDGLRAEIAVVTDDPFLFSATVAENIAYARPDASREAIEQAAERAQAAGFIARLPDGYETRVGERGLTLSGGQRQRIALARALVADPRILVLDDATSAVDATTEAAIKEALGDVGARRRRKGGTGRTTFVIAHRLSTIALADEIVVLEAGRIAARGTHEELLEVNAHYRAIVEKGLPDSVFLTRKPREPQTAGL
ncbi:MAG: Heterodimeric efflux ABC transporter, permease/ATP-binding subunit 1 / Heterodimeric efflux ABC transporter, permease/ATP-binding subunit 2 [uncultured Solirubrobacteraceae bacterium]|uniref:Heterodimeric efflux ABC transporter, permease/ATP-binding subunit 1 / Heterodimeric efflux ABC transporter, permease/ATP-binding subunit 2 n=1 Tax=uncultured Solirubrobacteraceae bacterium TaxID=1162706 RepID=A0A6J4SGD7_9ACTN|nr:MAG: Heterodimeric efflux ABC transporter, permease/ATP-binding subunit 1 / Heterodimeric efflux ABC transporter, permease/ATP-binding subunit 2 [uncultured Solirubrobacteraceae bacterium]